jgi:hypothetical protein
MPETETLDGILQFHVLTWGTGEGLSDKEWLREELLDLTGTRNGQSVIFGELVHTEDRDDVLQVFVALQYELNVTGTLVMLVTDNLGIEDPAGGIERVNRRKMR